MTQRNSVRLTKEDLRKRIIAAGGGDDFFEPTALAQALAEGLKVEFDFENFEMESERRTDLLGYRDLGGLTVWGMSAGGDWEFPVFFVVYYDGKKLRAYVPRHGNPWNSTTKQAYGNDVDADLADAKKRWPLEFRGAESVEADDFEYDWAKIRVDVEKRLKVVSKRPPKSVRAKMPHAERIESLTYYGTGDEGYELFREACSFCYSLDSLGMTKEAKVVCGWAEEMAWASEEDSDDETDQAKGYYGH